MLRSRLLILFALGSTAFGAEFAGAFISGDSQSPRVAFAVADNLDAFAHDTQTVATVRAAAFQKK